MRSCVRLGPYGYRINDPDLRFCRCKRPGSLLPERLDWIHVSGSARSNVTPSQSHNQQGANNRGERERIRCMHTKQQAGHCTDTRIVRTSQRLICRASRLARAFVRSTWPLRLPDRKFLPVGEPYQIGVHFLFYDPSRPQAKWLSSSRSSTVSGFQAGSVTSSIVQPGGYRTPPAHTGTNPRLCSKRPLELDGACSGMH